MWNRVDRRRTEQQGISEITDEETEAYKHVEEREVS